MEARKKQVVRTPEDIPLQASEEEFDQYQPQLSPEAQALMALHEDLKSVYGDDTPMISQLEGWKNRWTNLNVSKIGQDRKEYYIWRTLRRYEYKEMMQGKATEDAEALNEMLVEKCLLYPTYDFNFRQTTDAGVISTLGQQISYKSGFVSQQEALSLIYVA